jgi:hypothetical protein
MTSDAHRLSARLARWNAVCFGLVLGLLLGMGLFGATLLLVLTTSHPGAHLALLSNYLPGYTVSFGGAFLGFLWAFVVGAAFATPAERIYYLGVLRQIEKARVREERGSLQDVEARIHPGTFALAIGLFCGLLGFLATILLVLRHEPGKPLGPNLGLLGRFLPGYDVSYVGSALGFLYGLVLGGVAAALVGWIYNRIGGRGAVGTRLGAGAGGVR